MTLSAQHDTLPPFLPATITTNNYCVTLTADAASEDDSNRGAIDIAVALDISGSMSGHKLDMCKSTLVVLLNELKATDRFSLTTFDDEAQTIIPMGLLTPAAKDSAIRRVKSIHTRGCTNLSGGLTNAVAELQRVAAPSSVRSVLLLTDGHANRGVSDSNGILSLLNGCLGSTSNISVNVMGYGADHNADLLQKISQVSATSGSYYFIERQDDVSSAFGDCLGGLLSVAAQNIVVRIRGDGVVVKHDKAQKVADNAYTVSLGDMFAEESKDVCVCSAAGPGSIQVQVEYVDIINKRPVASHVVTCSVATGASLSPPNAHVALQHLRVEVVETMKAGNELSRIKKMTEARLAMTNMLARIAATAASLGRLSGPDQAIITMLTADINECLGSMNSYDEYQHIGSKRMMSKMQTHTAQRCNESSLDTPSLYRGAAKSKMAAKFSALSAPSK
jgi:Mg-chelatase subunit ChlD